MFEYGKIYMRQVELSDLDNIKNLRNDMSTWINLTEIKMLSNENQLEWYKILQKSTDKLYFVVYRKNKFIGIIRITDIDWVNSSACVGCDVVKKERCKGNGKQIMQMTIKYCFEYLNLHRLWLAVLDCNNIARKLYANVGFKEEGKFMQAIYREDKYHDYILMSVIKN